MDKVKRYPTSCTSYYCGKTKCDDKCRYKPALDEFKKWVKDNNAECVDPVWSPNSYVARS